MSPRQAAVAMISNYGNAFPREQTIQTVYTVWDGRSAVPRVIQTGFGTFEEADKCKDEFIALNTGPIYITVVKTVVALVRKVESL
jgi:hypothetical protein